MSSTATQSAYWNLESANNRTTSLAEKNIDRRVGDMEKRRRRRKRARKSTESCRPWKESPSLMKTRSTTRRRRTDDEEKNCQGEGEKTDEKRKTEKLPDVSIFSIIRRTLKKNATRIFSSAYCWTSSRHNWRLSIISFVRKNGSRCRFSLSLLYWSCCCSSRYYCLDALARSLAAERKSTQRNINQE